MRILHTADWHLGHSLHEVSREYEHDRFLQWLLDVLDREQVDVLIVAGDLFETANPPAAAEAALFDFVAQARRRFPRLQILLIGGNHDSAARLDAPRSILQALDVHVIGELPRLSRSSLDLDRILVPLVGRSGTVEAWCAAVPFLRPADLPILRDPDIDPLIEGVRQIYTEVFDEARTRRQPGQALIATGHCYMTGTRISELSERKVLNGNQHALPVDIFPEEVAYAALGHLHLAQTVGGRPGVRYAGSPIPLSLAEADYRHQVCLVDIEGEGPAQVRSIPIPRSVDILRLPQEGPLPLAEVLKYLGGLETLQKGAPEHLRPYLEVRVSLDRAEPGLRRQIDEALEKKAARLMKIAIHYSGLGQSLSEMVSVESLRDLTPEEVFLRRYERQYQKEPSTALLAAFHELVHQVHQEAP